MERRLVYLSEMWYTPDTLDNLKPTESEPICLISFEITCIRLGGGPEGRTGFWKAYREALAVNKRTKYQNDRVWICRNQIAALRIKPNERAFFRNGRLTLEKAIEDKDPQPGNTLH